MVQLTSFRLTLVLCLSSILSSEALPVAQDQAIDWTYPPFLPDRVAAPKALKKRSDTVIQATAAQIAEYTKYAGIAATAYCRTVVPLNIWNCTQCIKQVPDGKIVKTFSTLVTDTNGFVLRSDKEKVIYVAFRGTNSIRQGIDVTYMNIQCILY